MIPVGEQLVSLARAPQHLPPRRAGKRPVPSTLYRWVKVGVRGIKLEAIQVGGTLCTSLEALQRFFDRLTDPSQPTTTERVQRAAQQRAAAAFLDDRGV